MGDRADIFEQRSGRSLPATYRTFINQFDGGPRFKEATGKDAKPSDGAAALEYRLLTADELLAPYSFDGSDLLRPFFSAHILHLARMRDAGVPVFDGGPDPVSPERFESMNTIGVGATAQGWERGEPPTHLLVLDPADGSLRAVPTDLPAVVRRVSDSFSRWLKAAKRKPRKTTAKSARSKTAKKTKAPTVTSLLLSFKRRNKLSLPPAYGNFLKTHDGSATFPGPGGEQWQLATLAEFDDPNTGAAQTPDGPLPAFRLTRFYADEVHRRTGARFVPVFDSKQKFTLTRLRKGVVIGHCNGDPLFLDPTSKFSVWGYSREGKFVGKVADSFATFLKPKAEKATAPKPKAVRRPTRKVAAKPAAKAPVKTAVRPRGKAAA